MALIVKISANNARGQEIMNALEQIRVGLSTLQKHDGLRKESIAVSSTEMANNFGVSTDAQAQALSDRWDGLLLAYADSGNTEYSKLRDLVNAITYS